MAPGREKRSTQGKRVMCGRKHHADMRETRSYTDRQSPPHRHPSLGPFSCQCTPDERLFRQIQTDGKFL